MITEQFAVIDVDVMTGVIEVYVWNEYKHLPNTIIRNIGSQRANRSQLQCEPCLVYVCLV